jgi:hypothetical protein
MAAQFLQITAKAVIRGGYLNSDIKYPWDFGPNSEGVHMYVRDSFGEFYKDVPDLTFWTPVVGWSCTCYIEQINVGEEGGGYC